MVKELSLPSTVLTILKVVPSQMCIYWFSNMGFPLCQPKFGALPALQEYPIRCHVSIPRVCLIHCLGKTSHVTEKIVLGFSEVSKEKQSLFISLLCHDTPLRSGLKTICFPKIFKFFPSEGNIKTIHLETPSFVGVKVLSGPCTSLVLIVFHWWHFLRPIQKGWLAIAKLKPLSLFIPLF